jgi:hypothetical protein
MLFADLGCIRAKAGRSLTACLREMYDNDVRRILAAALLAFFSFSLINPALLADTASKLPSCCRRAGKHHCAMVMAEAGSSSGPALQPSRCRFFPQGRVATAPPNAGLLKTSRVACVSMMSRQEYRLTGDPLYRMSFYSTCRKRGPPSLLA